MSIATLVRSYGLTDFLPAVLKSYAWVDKILVMNYRFNQVPPKKDDTVFLTLPFKNVEVMSGDGLSQEGVFNTGLEKLKDFDYVFIADNDELITRADQQKLIDGLGAEVGTCNLIDYKDVNNRYPLRGHHPAVIVKPHVRFYDVRCFSAQQKYFPDVNMHHFGFAYKDLNWKLEWETKLADEGFKNILCYPTVGCEAPEEIRNLI